jgi:hypothetical protein
VLHLCCVSISEPGVVVTSRPQLGAIRLDPGVEPRWRGVWYARQNVLLSSVVSAVPMEASKMRSRPSSPRLQVVHLNLQVALLQRDSVGLAESARDAPRSVRRHWFVGCRQLAGVVREMLPDPCFGGIEGGSVHECDFLLAAYSRWLVAVVECAG